MKMQVVVELVQWFEKQGMKGGVIGSTLSTVKSFFDFFDFIFSKRVELQVR